MVRMRILLQFLATLGLSLWSFSAMASSNSTSLGDIANTLLQPTALVTKLLLLACYVIGIALILMAFAQYKIHRQSPKLVPLSTPIILLVLGVIALMIPYVTNQFETGNAEKFVQKDQKPTLLPLPDVTPSKGPGLPLPSKRGELPPPPPPLPDNRVNPAPERPLPDKEREVTNPNQGSGGSWADDPRYN